LGRLPGPVAPPALLEVVPRVRLELLIRLLGSLLRSYPTCTQAKSRIKFIRFQMHAHASKHACPAVKFISLGVCKSMDVKGNVQQRAQTCCDISLAPANTSSWRRVRMRFSTPPIGAAAAAAAPCCLSSLVPFAPPEVGRLRLRLPPPPIATGAGPLAPPSASYYNTQNNMSQRREIGTVRRVRLDEAVEPEPKCEHMCRVVKHTQSTGAWRKRKISSYQ
jgi:hypothetical protein